MSLSAPPSFQLHLELIHNSVQSRLTLNQQQTSFPYEIPGTKSYRMGVWGLICLHSGGRDIKTLEKHCSVSIANEIWIYILDTRLQSQRRRGKSWGVVLAWLRLDGILCCRVWFWLSRRRTVSIPAPLQGHGLTGGRNNHHARVLSLYRVLFDGIKEMLVCILQPDNPF